MPKQEINERIAKLCGWTVEVEDDPEDGEMYVWTSPCGKEHFTGPGLYSESLDKCREFESKYTFEEQETVLDWLCDKFGMHDAIFKATPLQRCEAFLRMKGQWE